MSNQNVEDMYSKDEKVLALSMYKHSGKGYKFLRKIFGLPSRQTISKLLNAIPINTGVNNVLFKYLKESSLKMAKKDKYCVLFFDEMCLSPSIQYEYNKYSDIFIEFEDFGHKENLEIANHVLVFKLRGVFTKWK